MQTRCKRFQCYIIEETFWGMSKIDEVVRRKERNKAGEMRLRNRVFPAFLSILKRDLGCSLDKLYLAISQRCDTGQRFHPVAGFD